MTQTYRLAQKTRCTGSATTVGAGIRFQYGSRHPFCGRTCGYRHGGKTHKQQCLLSFGGGWTLARDSLLADALGTATRPYRLPHIGWLAVSPTAGKKGIGAQLLDFIEQDIARDQLKCPAVTLGTAVEHPWLPKLYENRGYEKFAETDLGLGHITVYYKKTLIKSYL